MHLSFQLIRTRFLALLDYNRERRSRTWRSSSNSFYSHTQFRAVNIDTYISFILLPDQWSMMRPRTHGTLSSASCFIVLVGTARCRHYFMTFEVTSSWRHDRGLSSIYLVSQRHSRAQGIPLKRFEKVKRSILFFYFLPFSHDCRKTKKKKKKEKEGEKVAVIWNDNRE